MASIACLELGLFTRPGPEPDPLFDRISELQKNVFISANAISSIDAGGLAELETPGFVAVAALA